MRKNERVKNFDPKIEGVSRGTDIFSAGNANWLKEVVIPLHESLDEIIPRRLGEIPPPLRQFMTRDAQNLALGVAIVSVTLFFAKNFGKKAADDFYEIVLKPHFRKCFEWMGKKLSGGNRKAQKVFVLNIWHEKSKVVVSVSIVGNDLSEIASQLELLGSVHSGALNWIAEHGVAAPVHHYRIENGKVNAKPLFLENVDDTTKLELAKKLPPAIPSK